MNFDFRLSEAGAYFQSVLRSYFKLLLAGNLTSWTELKRMMEGRDMQLFDSGILFDHLDFHTAVDAFRNCKHTTS
jgi:hypothetical protein